MVVKNDIESNSGSLEQLTKIENEFQKLCSEPENFLAATTEMKDGLLSVTKTMYDFMKDFEPFANKGPSLDQLLISGFDNEQIWQQIELQNCASLPKFKTGLEEFQNKEIFLNEKGGVKVVSEKKKKKKETNRKRKKPKEPKDNTTAADDDDGIDEDEESFDEEEESVRAVSKKKYKSTVVDDNFFQLRQMEDCLDQLEQEEAGRNETPESKSFFGKANDDDEENFTFEDFFDPPVRGSKNKGSYKETVGKESNNENGVDLDQETGDGHDDANDDDDDDVDNGDLGDVDSFADIDDNIDDGDVLNDDDDDDQDVHDKDDDDDGDEDGDEDDDEDVDEDVDDANEENDFSEDDDDDDDDEIDEDGDGDMIQKDNDENEALIESTFEKKQKRMQKKILKLEEENLSQQPWQLLGEAVAKKRPMNSLLEEFVTFDHTSTGAPTITEETTLTLEEIIKQRIKDQAWDDVKRREKPVAQAFEYKKATELNQEKSKVSLAEVYEKEYMKQMEEEKGDEENKEHVEIQDLMDKLFVQLDALSNFHFTPKPPQPEIKIISNAPSLQIEEVLPVTVSESTQLAPEEIHEKKKGSPVGTEEKTAEDRKRERRQKKLRKLKKLEKSGKAPKSKTKEALDNLKKGTQNTIVKTTDGKQDKNTKSSSQFFDKLQEEVKKTITKKTVKENEKQRTKKTAENLKL